MSNELALEDREQIFVREMVSTGDPLYATMRSGIKDGDAEMADVARKLTLRVDLQDAIRQAQLEQKYSRPIEFTNRSIAQDLERVFDAAFRDKDWKACISAKTGQMQALGLLIQKVEITKNRSAGEMTTAQLEAYLRDHPSTIEGESQRVIDIDAGDSSS